MVPLIKSLNRALEALLAFLMGLLVLDVLWQVFTRFVLADASSVTEEVARFLLIWISLLGAAYVFGRQGHLAIDILPNRLTGRAKHRLEIAIDLLVGLFTVTVLVAGGMRLVWVTLYLGQTSAALGIPLGLVYTALPLSGMLILMYLGGHAIQRRREAPWS